MNWTTNNGNEVDPTEDGEYLVVRLRGGLSTRPTREVLKFNLGEWEDYHVVAYMELPELPLDICEDFARRLRGRKE